MTPLLARRAAPDRAFESFYRKHVGEVYHYALAVLANPADAEDVVQTTFLNAYRAFQRGERPRKPHNWLIKIAHNVCRMRWRQASRRPQEVPIDNLPEVAGPATEDLPDLGEVLEALAALTLNQRAALVMREIEGRTYAEIAEILNLSVPAVEALLFRARRGLKVRSKALGVISAVPLPGSLTSFFGGSGLVAAGGLLGGTVLKLVAAVAAGVVAAGAGYETVKAVAGESPPPVRHAGALAPPALLEPSPFRAALGRALPVRHTAALASARRAKAERSARSAHHGHARTTNPGLAATVGSPQHGRYDMNGAAPTETQTPTTATVVSAVGTVTSKLPAPVRKLVPKPPVPPVPPVPPLPPLPTVPTVPVLPPPPIH